MILKTYLFAELCINDINYQDNVINMFSIFNLRVYFEVCCYVYYKVLKIMEEYKNEK